MTCDIFLHSLAPQRQICGLQVLATDELQTFVLPANAAVGRFLRVCLHGKVQRQLEDLNFYAAMR